MNERLLSEMNLQRGCTIMKEIADITSAFRTAQQQGLQTALATVVLVEGSAYRQPGARMLITETGMLTGAISGGCLEGDALRKAQLAIQEQRPVLVTYDTSDEEDAAIGLQLGCEGIVHILIEPIDPGRENHPLQLLEKTLEKREPSALVTLFSLADKKGLQPGTCLWQQGQHTLYQEGTDGLHHLQEAIATALHHETSAVQPYETFTAFIQVVQPPVQLVVAGAGNDVIPVVQVAGVLGWHCIVADGRSNYATPQRFPAASCTLMGKPDALMQQFEPDARTAVLLMTHNYNYDLAMLRRLLPLSLPYIGLLGPKKKRLRLLQELEASGLQTTTSQLEKLYGPTGLDIGAETAETIAVAIIAEIQAVLNGKSGTMLRDKQESIHAATPPGNRLQQPTGSLS